MDPESGMPGEVTETANKSPNPELKLWIGYALAPGAFIDLLDYDEEDEDHADEQEEHARQTSTRLGKGFVDEIIQDETLDDQAKIDKLKQYHEDFDSGAYKALDQYPNDFLGEMLLRMQPGSSGKIAADMIRVLDDESTRPQLDELVGKLDKDKIARLEHMMTGLLAGGIEYGDYYHPLIAIDGLAILRGKDRKDVANEYLDILNEFRNSERVIGGDIKAEQIKVNLDHAMRKKYRFEFNDNGRYSRSPS